MSVGSETTPRTASIGRSLILLGGLGGTASLFLPWINFGERRLMPVRYLFTDAPTLVPFPALFLGPGPMVILIASLITMVIGILLVIRSQRRHSRALAKVAIAMGLVVALISAYYAVGLAVPPHRINFPEGGIGVEGAESGFALIGTGLVVAFVGGVIGVGGGAMVIKGESLKLEI